jgi:hypothetical protein
MSRLLALLVFFSHLHQLTQAIKTRSSWNKLFHSNAHKRYDSEEIYQQKIDLSLSSEDIKQLYVLQYRENCGHICHQFLLSTMKERLFVSEEFHYEILNSDHGVIRTSLKVLRSLHSTHRGEKYLLDYVPFLPELKYALEVDDEEEEQYCGDLNELTLHVVFTLLPSDGNISSFIIYGVLQETQTLTSSSRSTFPSSEQISHSIVLPCSLFALTPFATILHYYSHLPIVHWIEIRSPSYPFTKYANSLTQIDPPDGSGVSHSGQNIYQLYQSMNLTGQSQIIGISDTGIDVSSCSFYDPSTSVRYNTLNPHHRKILYYQTYIDSTDSYGHGTAVSGIAAGECLYPLDPNLEKKRKQYDSVASKAKIAFFDISGPDNVLRIPSDINTNLLQVLYSTGARIMSVSWGSSANRYTIDSRCVSRETA